MKRIASILLTVALVLSCTVVAFAAGGIVTSADQLSIMSGSSATFTVTADNAAGRIDVHSTNPAVATVSLDKAWLDKDSVEITVKGVTHGSCQIVIENTDVATYEEEVISGQEIVDVYVQASNVDTPVLTGASNAPTGVNVKWNAVKDAEQYRVFYKTANGSWTKAGDTTDTSYTVTGLTSGTNYTFTVRCVNREGTVYTSSFDATGKTVAYLAAPVLTDASISSADGVTVKWNAVRGAENYRVFYRTPDGSWTKAGDTTGTSYTVTGLTSDTEYIFTARCINKAGTAYTSSFDAEGRSAVYMAMPVIKSVSNTTDGVTMNWNAVKGAEKYRVYYKTAGSSWRMAGDTTGTSYTATNLTSGTSYTFTVRGINNAGSNYTTWYDSTGKTITYLTAPVMKSANAVSSGVSVTWDAVKGAAKYRVFYRTPDGSWTKAGETTGTSYTVTGLTVGKTYIFTARCINSAGTAYTSSFDASGKVLTYVSTPVLTGASNAPTGVNVSWKAVDGAENYGVFYKPAGGSWTKAGETTGTSYTVTGLNSGTNYTFTARCLSSDGTAYASWFDSTGKTVAYLAAPAVTNVKAISNGVSVSWNAVKGAAKYRVFYRTPDGSWTKAGETTGTSYTVTGLTAGKTYIFTARCINSAGTAYTSSFDANGMRLTYLNKPVLKSVNNTSTGVSVSWNAVEGAEKYGVFYKTTDGSWIAAGTTTDTNYTVTGLTSGTSYTFTVRCVSGDGALYASWFDSTGKSIIYKPAV